MHGLFLAKPVRLQHMLHARELQQQWKQQGKSQHIVAKVSDAHTHYPFRSTLYPAINLTRTSNLFSMLRRTWRLSAMAACPQSR